MSPQNTSLLPAPPAWKMEFVSSGRGPKSKDIITSEVRLKHIHLHSILIQGSESIPFKTLIDGHVLANITRCTYTPLEDRNPNIDSSEAAITRWSIHLPIQLTPVSCSERYETWPPTWASRSFNIPPDYKPQSRALSSPLTFSRLYKVTSRKAGCGKIHLRVLGSHTKSSPSSSPVAFFLLLRR